MEVETPDPNQREREGTVTCPARVCWGKKGPSAWSREKGGNAVGGLPVSLVCPWALSLPPNYIQPSKF